MRCVCTVTINIFVLFTLSHYFIATYAHDGIAYQIQDLFMCSQWKLCY